MAVDEALLESYDSSDPQPAPTLRLYAWRPAAVSLGRRQSLRGAHDATVTAGEGIDLVRRPTGGGAVLHELERTYAVVGARGLPPFSGGVIATYRSIADAVARGITGLGVAAIPVEPRGGRSQAVAPICFERVGAWEIVALGRKLVGSAQARRRRAFLQHGSIPIHLDPRRLAAVLGAPVDASRFVDLEQAMRGAVDPEALDASLVAGFAEVFDADLIPGTLTESEALRAAELRCWKYDSMAWTHDGEIGRREARWGPSVSR
jgi:lipoate-protein ligase A